MKLICLGTAGFHPNASRHTTCFVLPEVGVVLDAGTGLFRLGDHLQTDRLVVLLSHAHLDHVVGLTYLLEWFLEDPQRVTIRGEESKLAAIRTHLFAEELFPIAPNYQFESLASNHDLPGGGRLTWFPLRHPGGSVGYRLDFPDQSLGYVTDTTADPAAAYLDAIRGVDLLIHESNFPTGHDDIAQRTGHSCLNAVAQVAAAAGVGRLLIAHVDPLLSERHAFDLASARAIFPHSDIATDHAVVDF